MLLCVRVSAHKNGILTHILMWRYVCYLLSHKISHPCVIGYLNKQNSPCGRHFLISPSTKSLPQETYTIFSKVYESTSFRDPNVRGASVTSATHVCASAPLLLLLLLSSSSSPSVRNMRLWLWGVQARYQVCAKFWKNQSALSKVKVMKQR